MQPCLLTIGVFDGVHKGHQTLFMYAAQKARELSLASLCISFHPHPEAVLRHASPQALCSVPERIQRIKSAGIEQVHILPFTKELAARTGRHFCAQTLVAHYNMHHLIVGHDFVMGSDRAGYAQFVAYGQEFGFCVEEAPTCLEDGVPVSSSRIRAAILAGEIEKAEALLGRPYYVESFVVHGFKRGRTMGFPTANMQTHDILLPKTGVYATSTCIPGNPHPYQSITSIGHNPTFGENTKTLETYLLDFDGDLYGQTLRLIFHTRMRDEVKFSSKEALIAQLEQDKQMRRTLKTFCQTSQQPDRPQSCAF